MRKRLFLAIAVATGLAAPVLWAQQKKALEVYFIDVEGGQSTLFVSPSGQSLLVDTGWAGARDASRIASVAKLAGVSQIDYLVLTHYHGDHAGGVVELASRIPINHFVDHGPSQEETRGVPQTYAAYLTVRKEGQHILAKPGDKIPIPGIDVQVISSAAETIAKPLQGAGAANPLCADFAPKDETLDPLVGGENKQSVGIVISLGKFRLGDFGDQPADTGARRASPRGGHGQRSKKRRCRGHLRDSKDIAWTGRPLAIALCRRCWGSQHAGAIYRQSGNRRHGRDWRAR